MPLAAHGGARRRTALGPRFGYGVHAAQYRVVERWEGVRIEHPLRHVVDLRFSAWHIEVASETRRTRLSIFAPMAVLTRAVAAKLLDLPDSARDADLDAVRREAWAIAEVVQPVRRRLFDRHAPDASAIEERMVEIRGHVPRLAHSPMLYRTPYLARDVRRFRAAAIALAFLEDELLPPTADGRPLRIPALRRAMLEWRRLFAPGGVSYRSLDRTLMNLPAGVPPQLVCALRHVRLERPITDPIELHLLLQCVALAAQRDTPIPWLHALQHARAATIRRALSRLARATGSRELDPLSPPHMQFVAAYLLDAECGAPDTFETVVRRAIHLHVFEMIERRVRALRARRRRSTEPPPSRATPTAPPPLPPPQLPGLHFLATVGAVMDEAQRMGHCIGFYVERAVSGDCFLFHAERHGESASIEVGAEGRVRQAAGPRNRRNAVCTWATRVLEPWIARWPAPTDRRG
jgi:hypothetical protein